MGSGFGDVLTGDTGGNEIWGGAGDDAIAGGGGSDRLFGGSGNDTLVSVRPRRLLLLRLPPFGELEHLELMRVGVWH